jgi:hypothetical protein
MARFIRIFSALARLLAGASKGGFLASPKEALGAIGLD